MNIIIAGDGKVGSTLAQQLSAEGHDITLIDSNQQVLNASLDRFDVIGVHGNGASMPVLLNAGVKDADLLIAATSADEVNLLCCTTAHGINPNLHTIARIRNPEYSEQIYAMRDVFALSMSVNPERQAAVEIERLLKYPGFLRRDVFAKGRSEIVELRIEAGSKLCNVRLQDLNSIIKCRVLICAVVRSGQALVPNSGDFRFLEGDRIFVTAPTKNLTELLKNLDIITRRVRRVMLCGGGRVSYYLASALEKSGISVLIVEKEKERCLELSAMLPHADIIHGDAGDLAFLESLNLSKFDALVALTGLDELNMIISSYATSLNLPQVITKVGHSGNRQIMDRLKLGSIICPKDLVCTNIVRYVRAMQNQSGAAISIHSIADGMVEAMEFLVDESTPNCGIALKNLNPRSNVLIAGISHGSKTEIPNGDSMFHPGDTVVVVTTDRGTVHQLSDIFA